jgi:hypothetical protein
VIEQDSLFCIGGRGAVYIYIYDPAPATVMLNTLGTPGRDAAGDFAVDEKAIKFSRLSTLTHDGHAAVGLLNIIVAGAWIMCI